jgi:cell wall-associated NlpC family hydrolase
VKKLLTLTALLLVSTTVPALAGPGSGGLGPTPPPNQSTKARLLPNGKAQAPAGAPKAVIDAIQAANRIVDKPYCYGGGHGSSESRCYDCSGTVSYALKAAGLIRSPMASPALARWGKAGKGDWITVYANSGHAYMVIAGLRLDTANTPGDGPGWSRSMYSTRGKFAERRPAGL